MLFSGSRWSCLFSIIKNTKTDEGVYNYVLEILLRTLLLPVIGIEENIFSRNIFPSGNHFIVYGLVRHR